MGDYPWRNEDRLKQLYITEEKTSREIADQFGCAKSTVIDWLEKYDLGPRERNNKQHPWHNEDLLRELYFEEGLNQYEIADRLGCEQVTIAKWFGRHDIDTDWEPVDKLRDEDWLREMYLDKELSQHEIADRLDCGQMSVSRWCKKYGIETRKANYEKDGYYHFHDGYEAFSNCGDFVLIHRLQMVAEEGIEAVKGMEVHHKNEVRWDNRPCNLELKEPSEHMRGHALKRLREGNLNIA